MTAPGTREPLTTNHGTPARGARRATGWLFVLLAGWCVASGLASPHCNWDAVMYVAAATSFEEPNPAALHELSYAQLKAHLPADQYRKFIRGKYRKSVHDDLTVFQEQLAFYRARPLYSGSVLLLSKLGVNIVAATHVVSLIAVVAALGILTLVAVRDLEPPLAVAVPILALAYRVPDLARLSTPDGLAFLAVVAAASAHLSGRTRTVLILLPVMLLIRPDLILLTVPFAVAAGWAERTPKAAALSVVTSVVTYGLVVGVSGHPGWAVTFTFSFVTKMLHPLTDPVSLTVTDYVRVLISGVEKLIDTTSFWVNIVISLCGVYMLIYASKNRDIKLDYRPRELTLIVACNVYILTHFALFPLPSDRFFAGAYMVSAVAFLSMVGGALARERRPVGLERRRALSGRPRRVTGTAVTAARRADRARSRVGRRRAGRRSRASPPTPPG